MEKTTAPVVPDYDYIIAGSGCAGLSLLVHMIRSGKFQDKKILLVDKAPKAENDRTWCFWETDPGLFEDVVYRSWSKLWVHTVQESLALNIQPYAYKLIRGIDFYNYCYGELSKEGNIEISYGEIQKVESVGEIARVVIGGKEHTARFVFNSILFQKPLPGPGDYWLLQHFRGWVIDTAAPVFNSREPQLMDFRVDQQHGTAFVYVMPFSDRQALVEYTLFSRSLLEPGEYDAALRDYIENVLNTGDFNIASVESGVIPMTSYRFPSRQGNVINIGTAGGQTKGSTGYTFRFIQKHSAAIVSRLLATGKPYVDPSPRRFRFYDRTLLSVLSRNAYPAPHIFMDLFKKNKPQQVLRFLDNETSFKEDLQIISSLPTVPFLKAALRRERP